MSEWRNVVIVLTGGRASGKTSALIRWVMENPSERGILCLDEQRARHIIHMFERVYPNFTWEWKHNVVTVQYMLYSTRGRGNHLSLQGPFREIGIDDAEEVLSRLFGSRVGMAVMNATWIPLGNVSDNNDRVKAYVEEPISIDAPYGGQRGKTINITNTKD
jgi:hypothetical protein